MATRPWLPVCCFFQTQPYLSSSQQTYWADCPKNKGFHCQQLLWLWLQNGSWAVAQGLGQLPLWIHGTILGNCPYIMHGTDSYWWGGVAQEGKAKRQCRESEERTAASPSEAGIKFALMDYECGGFGGWTSAIRVDVGSGVRIMIAVQRPTEHSGWDPAQRDGTGRMRSETAIRHRHRL